MLRFEKRSQSLRALALATFLGALLLAAPMAGAQGLTGTWEGEAVCTGFFAGEKFKDTFSSDLHITEDGSDLNMEFLGVLYNGALIFDNKDFRKAEGPFIACSTQAEPIGPFSEIGHMKVQVDEAKNKTSFKAESIFAVESGGTVVATCKWTFKRVDAADPAVPACSSGT